MGYGVVLAGLAAVAFFICESVLPAARVLRLPRLPAAWMEYTASRLPLHKAAWIFAGINTEIVCALLGLLVMLLGAAIVRRQRPLLEGAERAAEDRLRRVHQYMGDGRVEPYIGRVITVAEEIEPR
jgi:xanthosine utilization system XapX-like protein